MGLKTQDPFPRLSQAKAGRLKTLLLALALRAVCCVAQADPPGNSPGHFLFVVDTSFSMNRRAEASQRVVADLLLSGMNGQMRAGDTVGIWTCNERVRSDSFAARPWTAGTRQAVAAAAAGFLRQATDAAAADYLRQQRYGTGTTLEDALRKIQETAREKEWFTALILTDGGKKFSGTPYDREINDLCHQAYSTMAKARWPFVIILRAYHGKYVGYVVNLSWWPLKFPPFADLYPNLNLNLNPNPIPLLQSAAVPEAPAAAPPAVSAPKSNTAVVITQITQNEGPAKTIAPMISDIGAAPASPPKEPISLTPSTSVLSALSAPLSRRSLSEADLRASSPPPQAGPAPAAVVTSLPELKPPENPSSMNIDQGAARSEGDKYIAVPVTPPSPPTAVIPQPPPEPPQSPVTQAPSVNLTPAAPGVTPASPPPVVAANRSEPSSVPAPAPASVVTPSVQIPTPPPPVAKSESPIIAQTPTPVVAVPPPPAPVKPAIIVAPPRQDSTPTTVPAVAPAQKAKPAEAAPRESPPAPSSSPKTESAVVPAQPKVAQTAPAEVKLAPIQTAIVTKPESLFRRTGFLIIAALMLLAAIGLLLLTVLRRSRPAPQASLITRSFNKDKSK